MIIVKINKLLQTKLKALICCLILMFAAKASLALAKIDSSKVALDSVPYFFKDDFSNYQLLDTNLNELHRYNPLFKTGNFYFNLRLCYI
jgi:hypothetical protein